MPHARPFPAALPRRALWAGALLGAAVAVPGLLAAQDSGDSPAFRFGVSVGLVAHDNRALEATSAGSTFEYISRLDFDLTFATPIQQLEVTGDIGLRHVTGAEDGALDSGLVEPSIAIGYAQQARDAQLSVDLRFSESDVSSSTLEEIIGVPDPQLVTAEGTRASTVFNTELELRRRAPFGLTLTAGYTGLRYSDIVGTSLTDQDRFRIGALLRMDINPTLQANLNFRYSTFEDFGTTEGVRETFSLNADLSQSMRDGATSLLFNAVSTEEGERYSLSARRELSTPVWEVSGTLGVTLDIEEDLLPNVLLSLERALPEATLSARFSQRVASGSDDQEQQITSLSLSYDRQITALTRFSTSITYSETDDTAASNTSSFGTLGVSLQRSLTPDIQLNLGLQHRVSEDNSGARARDNRLSITLRRDLSLRR